jgi:hypothetical protein
MFASLTIALLFMLALLQVHTAADSVAAVTWLTGAVGNWLGFLPESTRLAVVATAVSLAFAALERAVLWVLSAFPAIAPILEEWKAGHVVTGAVNWKRMVNAVVVFLLGWWMSGNPLAGLVASGIRSMVKAPSGRTSKTVALLAGLLLAAPAGQAAEAPAPPSRVSAFAHYFSIAPGAGARWEPGVRWEDGLDHRWWLGAQVGLNVTEHVAVRGRAQWDFPLGKTQGPRAELGLWLPL